MMLKNNMGSVLAEGGFNAAVIIKDSPYCNTLHIVPYGELPIWGILRDQPHKSFYVLYSLGFCSFSATI